MRGSRFFRFNGYYIVIVHSVQFSSVESLSRVQVFATPWITEHQASLSILEFTQTHVHRVDDAIQPSHPLSSPSPPTPNPSQHQCLFQWVNYSHEVAKVLVSALASFLPKKSFYINKNKGSGEEQLLTYVWTFHKFTLYMIYCLMIRKYTISVLILLEY